jgi:hypothetical protein
LEVEMVLNWIWFIGAFLAAGGLALLIYSRCTDEGSMGVILTTLALSVPFVAVCVGWRIVFVPLSGYLRTYPPQPGSDLQSVTVLAMQATLVASRATAVFDLPIHLRSRQLWHAQRDAPIHVGRA